MTLAIEWTNDAKRDFGRIDDHYADVAPDFAARVSRIAARSARRIADYPAIGPIVDGEFDIRKWHVGDTDFLLFYRALADRIQNIRVRHMAEDWKPKP
jgi:toxin ParE1/3/4